MIDTTIVHLARQTIPLSTTFCDRAILMTMQHGMFTIGLGAGQPGGPCAGVSWLLAEATCECCLTAHAVTDPGRLATEATLTTKRATELAVVSFRARCPCGGRVLSTATGGYLLVPDERYRKCDTCGAAIEVTNKTAHL